MFAAKAGSDISHPTVSARITVGQLIIEHSPLSIHIRDKSGLDAFLHASSHGTLGLMQSLIDLPLPTNFIPTSISDEEKDAPDSPATAINTSLPSTSASRHQPSSTTTTTPTRPTTASTSTSRPTTSRTNTTTSTITTLNTSLTTSPSHYPHAVLPPTLRDEMPQTPLTPTTPTSRLTPTIAYYLSTRTSAGDTALHLAAAAGELKTVRLLISLGADEKAVNNAGWRPAAYSASVSAEVYLKGLVREREGKRVVAGIERRETGDTIRASEPSQRRDDRQEGGRGAERQGASEGGRPVAERQGTGALVRGGIERMGTSETVVRLGRWPGPGTRQGHARADSGGTIGPAPAETGKRRGGVRVVPRDEEDR